MKAVVYDKYGLPDTLRLAEVAKPAPADGEVLIKIHASSVNFSDWAMVRGKPFLVRLMTGSVFKPGYPILGKDVAGRVEAVGQDVHQFKPGDAVYGDLSDCGFGAFAEYVAVPETAVALKPDNLTFETTAAVPEAAVVALQGLRDKGHIQAGQKVLINGASGGIGTFAVQVAKAFGAEVTAVCSTRNLDMVRSIGADFVIDYTREDFTRSGKQYDLILAAAGYRSLFDYRRALRENGRYVVTGGSMAQIFQPMYLGPWLSRSNGQAFVNLTNKPNQQDLTFMKEIIESGKVVPVIDRCYPLHEVAAALSYYGEGHSQGKVVILHTQRN